MNKILSLLAFLFFVLGFALGLNGLLIPFLQGGLNLSSTQSYGVLAATFGAFAILGYPAGLVVAKIGYKKSMLLSFLLFACGLYLFIPSAKSTSYTLFLVASFMSGAANTLLQAVVNPYVTLYGDRESAATRICIMGILNKAGWAVAPIFLSLFIDIKAETLNLSELSHPFYIIVMIFIALAMLLFFVSLPEIKAEGQDESSDEIDPKLKAFLATKKSIFDFPHLLLGVGVLFGYVGVETITLASIVDFASYLQMANPQVYTSLVVGCMVAGYICGIILIPKFISQLTALRFCVLFCAINSILVLILPASIAIYLIALLGFGHSLIWSATWPLAISNLGRFTNKGSALLVMAIVGGAVLPLAFGVLKDSVGSMQNAYAILIPIYLFMVFYAFRGYNMGLKKLEKNG